MKKNMQNEKEIMAGRSIVEMLSVLAIMSVIGVMGVWFGADLLYKNTASKTVQEVGMQAVETAALLAKGNNDISLSSNATTETGYGLSVSLDSDEDDTFFILLSDVPGNVCQHVVEPNLPAVKSVEVISGDCAPGGSQLNVVQFSFEGSMMLNNFAGEYLDDDGNIVGGTDDWKDVNSGLVDALPTVCPSDTPYLGLDGECYGPDDEDDELPLLENDCARLPNRFVNASGECQLLACGVDKYADTPYEHPTNPASAAQKSKGIFNCVECVTSPDCPEDVYCVQPGDDNYSSYSDRYTCKPCSQYKNSGVIRNKDDAACSCPVDFRPYCANTTAGTTSNCKEGGRWQCISGCTQNSDCDVNQECTCQGASCSATNIGKCVNCPSGTYRAKNGSHCASCLGCQRAINGQCEDMCDNDEVCMSSSCKASADGNSCYVAESSSYATCLTKPQLIQIKGLANDRIFYIPPPTTAYRMTAPEAARFCESYGYKLANLQEACLKDYKYDSGYDCYNITSNSGSSSNTRSFTTPVVTEITKKQTVSCEKGESGCYKVSDGECLVVNGKVQMEQAVDKNGNPLTTFEVDENGKNITVPVYTDECVMTDEIWEKTITITTEKTTYKTYSIASWNISGTGSFWIAGNYGCTSLRITYSCGNNHAAGICDNYYPLCTQP